MSVRTAPAQLVDYCVLAKIYGRFIPTSAKMLNTLTFATEDPFPTLDEVNNIASIVATWCNDVYSPVVGDDVAFDRVLVTTRAEVEGPYADIPLGVTGAVANNTESGIDPAWAPLVLLNCGLSGRRHHGRMYGFTPANAFVGQGTGYNTLTLEAYTDAVNTLKSTAATAGYPLVIASPSTNSFKLVTSLDASKKLTLQTRRRQGFGDW